MNNIMLFEGNEVEVFELNGQVLFNPYNVGACLGINDITVRRHMQGMNKKQVIKLTNSIVQDMNFRKLHNTGENFLTESGVYKLIFKSNKEEAERFQDWVTDEVLPTLRKTGQYIVLPQPKSTIELLELEFKAIQEVSAKLDDVNTDLQEFKTNIPLFAVECDELTHAVNCKIVGILGGKDTPAYKDNHFRGCVYSDIYKEIKRQFGVKSYKAIKRSEIETALNIVANYTLPIILEQELQSYNTQLAL